jgi:hypothetical protein
VGVATEALAGLVKSGGDIEVNPVTGGVAVKNADKLDGQHGSYYQNASNMNAGTLPAARLPAHTGDVTSAAGSAALSIAAGKVTDVKIASNAVTEAKINDGAVTNAKIASGVDAAKITAGTLPVARLPYSQLYTVTPKRSFGTEGNFSTYQESYAVNIADLRRIDVIQYNNPGTASGYFNFKIVFNNSGVSIDSNALYEKTIILDLRPATANIRPTRWTAGPNRTSSRTYSLEEAVTAGLSSGSPTVIGNLANKGVPNYMHYDRVNANSRFGIYNAFSKFMNGGRYGNHGLATATAVDLNTGRQASLIRAGDFELGLETMNLLGGMMLKADAAWSPAMNAIWLDMTPYYHTSQEGDW